MPPHVERTDRELLSFYQRHLTEVLLPFWQQSVDTRHGGVFNCYNNTGTALVSRDKYTWSQGRFIWLWSKIAGMARAGRLSLAVDPYLEQAKKAVDFINHYAFLANGNCAYLLTEEGEKKEANSGQGYDISFYADCFVILGFAQFAKVTEDAAVLERAVQLYHRVLERVQRGGLRSEPYPVPVGLKAHSVPMIMLNVTQELYDALRIARHPRSGEVAAVSKAFVEEILRDFLQSDGRIAEMVPSGGTDLSDTVLCRHVNPGHTIEDMWFILHASRQFESPQWIDLAALAVKKAFDLGWDDEYGGLLRFVDRDGGAPGGRETGDPYERLILDTWDTKLWWPHSEALYTTLLTYDLTGEEAFKDLYDRSHEYVFRTFPNPDVKVGEWIQIRDRQGQPIDKLVALPVKDPYHIIRNVLLTIELLHERGAVE